MDDLVGLFHLGEESVDVGVEFLIAVVIAVVADGMSLVIDAAENLRMGLCLNACHVECRMYASVTQDV